MVFDDYFVNMIQKAQRKKNVEECKFEELPQRAKQEINSIKERFKSIGVNRRPPNFKPLESMQLPVREEMDQIHRFMI
jgi:hypothetical protein